MFAATQTTDLVSRLRRTVSGIELNAESRDALERAFDRFVVLERRREIRSAIATERAQKQKIALLLGLLAELDELNDQERDHSVFMEVAVLFRAIAGCAAEGAAEIQGIVSHVPARSADEVDRPAVAGAASPPCCTICHLGCAG